MTIDLQDHPGALRAYELLSVGARTEKLTPGAFYFAAGRIMREEGFAVDVCTQMIYGFDHMGRRPVSREVFLCVDDLLVDEFGVYRNISELADDRRVRWQYKNAQADGRMQHYPKDQNKEDEEVHAGWGCVSQDMYDMQTRLEFADQASRLCNATPIPDALSAGRRL